MAAELARFRAWEPAYRLHALHPAPVRCPWPASPSTNPRVIKTVLMPASDPKRPDPAPTARRRSQPQPSVPPVEIIPVGLLNKMAACCITMQLPQIWRCLKSLAFAGSWGRCYKPAKQIHVRIREAAAANLAVLQELHNGPYPASARRWDFERPNPSPALQPAPGADGAESGVVIVSSCSSAARLGYHNTAVVFSAMARSPAASQSIPMVRAITEVLL